MAAPPDVALAAPPEPSRPPGRLTPGQLITYGWRQFTSMRTALLLLFLLAVAAVPGSVLPQRGVSPLQVAQFARDHPRLTPVLDRLGLFDVFAAPWFAAIYLALFVSLAGCVLPRARAHLATLRSRPPAPPRHLDRLPVHEAWTTRAPVEAVLAAGDALLRSKRFRVDRHGGALAAEAGFLRETGNLLFHLALLLLLVAVALGGLFGYSGTVLVKEGDGFANTVSSYDSFTPGRLFRDASLAPFAFTLDDFRATYHVVGPTKGTARSFDASVRYREAPDSPERRYDVRVNEPLRVGGTKLYLISHGYAPHFRVRDGRGEVVFDASVPFLPQDANFTSEGVVKVPDARPEPLGFSGFFAPTAVGGPRGIRSGFPAAVNPVAVLLGWSGDLRLGSGIPQSVYSLDTSRLTRRATAALGVGQTLALPRGLGSITLVGYEEWASFQVTYDPGKRLALLSAALILVGLLLSLFVRRRRVWVRAVARPDDLTAVDVAGLARTGEGSLPDEVRALVARLQSSAPAATPATGPAMNASVRPSIGPSIGPSLDKE